MPIAIDKAGTASLVVKLPSPHAKQELFIHSTKKRRIIKAGRRGGKTVGVSIYAVEEFIKGFRILYGVPVSDQLVRFWQEVVAALWNGFETGLLVKNETDHTIEWNPTVIKRLKPDLQKRYINNRIKAKTCWNADTLRGDYCDRLILDEYQLMDENTWAIVGAPMLADNHGDAVFCYTPPSLRSRSVSKAQDKQHARKLYAKAEKDPEWLALHFTSYDNPHLSPEGLEQVGKDMTETARRQEILAEEDIEVPGALWHHDLIETGWPKSATKEQREADPNRRGRIERHEMPELTRIVVGVDPSGSSTTEAGIVAAGIGVNGHGYVIADESLFAPTPERWGAGAVALCDRLKADRILGERNFGGDMVESTVRACDENAPYSDVVSSRGKLVRAEPVCALYERGLVHHVGQFPELEEEMCTYIPGNKSPNRMDALVFALTDLMLGYQSLGLIDYFKEGQAQRDLTELNKIHHATTLAKPMIADEAPGCPQCQSKLIHTVGGGASRCGQCGTQWLPKGKELKGFGMTRTQYLQDLDARRR